MVPLAATPNETDECVSPEATFYQLDFHLRLPPPVPFLSPMPNPFGLFNIPGGSNVERHNHLGGLLSFDAYWSPYTNIVFMRRTAVEASIYEQQNHVGFNVGNNELYRIAPHGLPMTAAETDRLHQFVFMPNMRTARLRSEGYGLLLELHRVACRISPDLRDASMIALVQSDFSMKRPPLFPMVPGPPPRAIPRSTRCILDPGYDLRNAPKDEIHFEWFDLDRWAQFIIAHHNPDTGNQFIPGIAIETTSRILRESIFGHVFCLALCPAEASGSHLRRFQRQFAYVVALPHFYQEAVDVAQSRGEAIEFLSPDATSASLHKITFERMRNKNLNKNDVIQVLLENGIPVEWIQHAYSYGVNYLDHHLALSPKYITEMRSVNKERLERLQTYGVPQPMDRWGGIFHPDFSDLRDRLILSPTYQVDPDLARKCKSFWILPGQAFTPDQVRLVGASKNP